LENESVETLRLLQEGQRTIQEHLPGVLENFMGLTQSTMKQDLIPPKLKELMAVAVAVGIRCQPCIVHHVKRALDQGATAGEILEACSVHMRFSPGQRLFSRQPGLLVREITAAHEADKSHPSS
jgi:AhpD family alkylhydroperoxidase